MWCEQKIQFQTVTNTMLKEGWKKRPLAMNLRLPSMNTFAICETKKDVSEEQQTGKRGGDERRTREREEWTKQISVLCDYKYIDFFINA